MDTKETIKTTSDLGWSALFAGQNKFKSIALALGVMLHATNVYLSTTIMPSIVTEIGGLEYYAWNTTIFVVASVIGSVISAHILAMKGPRKAYRLSILIFVIGTVICMIAPIMYIMLFGRFIQGLGGGLLFALSYAMIRIVFDKFLWPRAMALVSGMWGIAAFSGPFIGGVFAQYGQWRMAFATILIICLGLVTITEFILPTKYENHSKTTIPYLKLGLLTCSALSVSIGSVMESFIANLAGVIIALGFIAWLIKEENNESARLLPTGAYQITSALGTTYAVMVLLTIATTIEIFVPYFAQVIHGFSPLKAGYLTVLVAFGWTFSSIIFSGIKGKYIDRVIFIGSILMALGLVGLYYLAPQDYNVSYLLFTCLSLVLLGVGIGMGWPHLLTRVFSLAPSGEEELTSASVTTVQLMATAFGAAIAGLIANAGGMTIPGGVVGAKGASALLYGIFLIMPLIAAGLIVLYKRRKSRRV